MSCGVFRYKADKCMVKDIVNFRFRSVKKFGDLLGSEPDTIC